MGSDSDAPVMQAAVDVLREFQIPCEMTVASAHRSPERVMRLVSEAPGRGVKVFIVGAGAAAHLAGVVAAHSTLPVIGVPIDSSALKGLDALLSTVQMPPGVPVATVSIGKPGATNAGVLAAQILGVGDAVDGRPGSSLQEEARRQGRSGRGDELAAAVALRPPWRSPNEVSIVTFGCRVNQADSLHLEEQFARAAAAESPVDRRRYRDRQHLFGDGDGRPGCAADDPPHRPGEPLRAESSRPAVTRRGGPTMSRRCPNVVRVVPQRREARSSICSRISS